MKTTARALAVILTILTPGWFSGELQAQSLGAGFTQAGSPAAKGKVYSFDKIKIM